MTSIDDSLANLQFIRKAVEKLNPQTRLLCLPENSLYLNLGKEPIPRKAAFSKDSKEIQALAQLAKERNLFIHMGGIPWVIDDKVYNEALLLTDQGEIVETYEKLHLFDVNLGPDMALRESRSYNAGSRMNTFEIDGWKFATAICYDLRFPEIFVSYMEKDKVDAFLVPAAFTTKTGKIHWKPLLHARAIECQAYVLAAAQVGYHRDLKLEKLRKSWGQTLAFDPWGKVLKETASYEEFLDSNLTDHDPIDIIMQRAKIEDYRTSIPVSDHRVFQMELLKK